MHNHALMTYRDREMNYHELTKGGYCKGSRFHDQGQEEKVDLEIYSQEVVWMCGSLTL